jgi:murein DD-endopeptidase MepM/ murein hydrolase activator NlpD
MVSDATAEVTTGGDDPDSVGNNRDAPLPGRNRVTTGFYGYADHNGWDYAVPTGTPVHATHSGVIERIRYLTTSYGKHVFVRYGNVQMIYAHLSAINSGLREGATINSGDYIGKSGSTGRSTGPHLHYEERVSGTPRIPQFANNTGRVR